MSTASSGSLQPTYFGHVASTKDALVLFEACLSGTLSHVPRRPHDRERAQLIKSGCVFIYEENASGIKRWTDGVPWSPSRILGNFLVYRELLKPFPPGEKKRATKRNKRPSKPGEPYPTRTSAEPVSGNGSAAFSPTSPSTPNMRSDGSMDRESERALIGSLIDSYGFKEGGLVKKTMSVSVHGVHHHLVSYYKVDEVLNGSLQVPLKDPRVMSLQPRQELITRQNFRAPLDDIDDGIQDQMDGSHNPYGYENSGYDAQRHPMLNNPGQHPHQVATTQLGYYPGMPAYSSAPHMQPAIASYAPVQSPHNNYYAHQHNPASHVVPKTEDYSYGSAPYATRFESLNVPINSTGERGPPQPQQLQPSNYRPLPLQQPIQARPASMTDSSRGVQENKAHGGATYVRGGGGYYAQTAGTAPQGPDHAHANAPYNGHAWGMAAPQSGPPRPEGPGYSADGQYWTSMQTPLGGRQAPYQGGAAHN